MPTWGEVYFRLCATSAACLTLLGLLVISLLLLLLLLALLLVRFLFIFPLQSFLFTHVIVSTSLAPMAMVMRLLLI